MWYPPWAIPMTADDVLTDRSKMQPFAVSAALALFVGLGVYWLSCLVVAPTSQIGGGFEVDWHLMSMDPFALQGRFPHRILVPFSAWLLGFGGDGYMQFTRGLHVVLLASVCLVVLRYRCKVVDAVLVTGAVALTAPTQMYKLHWNGYTDPICYSLFLWMMLVARNPWVFWSLFFVNLMNHELAGFLLPWLWFLRRREDMRWRLDLILAGAACGVYLTYYLWVKATAQPLFNIDYFLKHPLFPGGTLAVWNLAGVHWVCTFGPMLAFLAWHQHAKLRGSDRWHLWLVLLGILVIFCIAFDWARHSNLLMLPLVVASAHFLAQGNRYRAVFALFLGVSVLLFWWIPPWTSSAWPTSVFADGLLLAQSGVVVVGPGGPFDIGFGPLSAVVGKWLPAIWKPLLVLHSIGAAIWLAGFFMARFGRKPD